MKSKTKKHPTGEKTKYIPNSLINGMVVYTNTDGVKKHIGVWFDGNTIISIEGPRTTPKCVLDHLKEIGFNLK